MERIWTTELAAHAGQHVRLAGWLQQLRRLSQVSFLLLRDGRGLAQVVVEDQALAEQLARLHHESVIEVHGLAVAEPQAPGGVELRDPQVIVLAAAAAPPPLELFRPLLKAQLPTLLDHAPLTLRHTRRRALWRLGAAALAGFRSTLLQLGFVEVQTPKLVGTATEGGANIFSVDYFGQPAYLAQSPQLYKQLLVGVFERVFEIGPIFRAEPHATPRHLNEYVGLDVELGFIADHTTVMELLTQVLRGMLAHTRQQAAAELELLGLRMPLLPAAIPVLHFSAAQALIAAQTGADLRDELDLSPAHERWLGAWASRTYGSDFLFVVGYPLAKRPFYTHPDPRRPGCSNSFDLLFRGLELATGGQRLHQYADYLAAMQARGMDVAPFSSYLQAFRHGMPPHGGFGMGLERWIAQLAGVANVREVALFPRDLQRLRP